MAVAFQANKKKKKLTLYALETETFTLKWPIFVNPLESRLLYIIPDNSTVKILVCSVLKLKFKKKSSFPPLHE